MERICRETDWIYRTTLTYSEMKRFVSHIFCAVLALTMLSAVTYGQEYVSTPVEISKEKIKVDGKICYSHIVLEKQTLYSISKAYGVSIEDIYRFNPTVQETGLKKNSILIIPSQDALKEEAPVQAKPKTEKPAEKVAEKKKTDVKKTEKKGEKAPVAERAQRIHIAKWYEDLDVIAEQYGITAEDIMAANNLKGRKLSKRQKLIIPYPGETLMQSNTEEVTSEHNTALSENTDIAETSDSTSVTLQPKEIVDATILMPLLTSEGEPNRNNLDFYCGALLAVYDMANEGIGCNLNVHDIHGSDAPFSVESLKNSDVIIGPVSTSDLTRLFNVIGDNTMVVSPLDPRAEKLVTSHSSMIQVPTPQERQYRDLVRWMEEENMTGDRVVMITEKGARQSAVTTVIREAIDSSSLAYKTFSYSILEGRDVTAPLTALMSTEGRNRILIASESEAFVNDVIRNLNLLIYNNIDIVIYTPSKIRSFETIEVENLHKTSLHVSLSYYIDYEDARVKDFLLKYRALYNTEPNQFAFQGYDVARYFISLCSKYGADWKEHIENHDMKMLQSTFNIRRQPIGGFANSGVRRIVYDNGYSVKAVK